jgi:hypothetical protein
LAIAPMCTAFFRAPTGGGRAWSRYQRDQKASASGSMIDPLPDKMAAAKEDACGSRRCM